MGIIFIICVVSGFAMILALSMKSRELFAATDTKTLLVCMIIPPVGWCLVALTYLKRHFSDVDALCISLGLTLYLFTLLGSLLGVGVTSQLAIVLAGILFFNMPLFLMPVIVGKFTA